MQGKVARERSKLAGFPPAQDTEISWKSRWVLLSMPPKSAATGAVRVENHCCHEYFNHIYQSFLMIRKVRSQVSAKEKEIT